MKNILIIYPHFPPSNLAGVHRPRLFAQHLPAFGWKPIILTVDEAFYEEAPDNNLVKLLPPELRIEKVKASPVGKWRMIGDIGLRSFFSLYRRAKQLVQEEKIDFVFIPIPSFYLALLGRWLHHSTGVKYGIDYIDPWVHRFPGSDRKFSRHWFSTKLAGLLEPIAVKKASLITGVAEGYYAPVLQRNPALVRRSIITGAMPYGGEASDHYRIKEFNIAPYLFKTKPGKMLFVYAGAMLPKAYMPLEAIFSAIRQHQSLFENVEFHFIGTGSAADDPGAYNIKPYAEKYGLWQKQVYEYPARIPYLDVLVHLAASDAIFILGSTEPHYTPSKTYQGVLSRKPILAALHRESSAVEVIRGSGAGIAIEFDGEESMDDLCAAFPAKFREFLSFANTFDPASVNMEIFESYSAYNVTGKLTALLNEAVNSR